MFPISFVTVFSILILTLCASASCDLSTDCYAPYTISVSPDPGDPTRCVCHCLKGFGGSRCQTGTIVDNGGYFSEYTVSCSDIQIFATGAQTECDRVAPGGWEVASVPSKEAHGVITSLTKEKVWIAGFFDDLGQLPDSSTGRQWYWNNSIVDLKKKHFADATACLPGSFCYFKPGAKLNQKCNYQTRSRLIIAAATDASEATDNSAPRYWTPAINLVDCVKSVMCVACERASGPPPPTLPTVPTSQAKPTTTTAKTTTTVKPTTPKPTTAKPVTTKPTTTTTTTTSTTTTKAAAASSTTTMVPSTSESSFTTAPPPKTETEGSKNGKSKTTLIIIMGIVGAIVLIGLILLAIFLIRRRVKLQKLVKGELKDQKI